MDSNCLDGEDEDLFVQEEAVDPLHVLDGYLCALPLLGHQVGHGDQLDRVTQARLASNLGK